MTHSSATIDSPVTAAQHVESVVRSSGTSFLWGMRILPEPRRRAMFAIYAFCREVDDVADEPGTEEEKLAELEEWRREIDSLYEGQPNRPTTKALAGPVRDFELPKEEFLAVIDGMEMDARELMVAPSLEDLEALLPPRGRRRWGCSRFAAFGAAETEAKEIAVCLGEALQMTNILRDLAEDADRGRLYLPLESLEAAGAAGLSPEAVLQHPGLVPVSTEMAAMAHERFERTRRLMSRCDQRHLKPCVLMMQVYERRPRPARAARLGQTARSRQGIPRRKALDRLSPRPVLALAMSLRRTL